MKGVLDLRYFIEQDISKARALSLSNNTNDPEKSAAALWDFVLLNEHPLSWRATWFLEHLGAEDKEYVRPYLNLIIEAFPSFIFAGQRRSSLKILQMFPVVDYDYARMVDICFDLYLSNSQPVAVRMFSLRQLYDIIKVEPELKQELKGAIELVMTGDERSLQSISRKILAKVSKTKK